MIFFAIKQGFWRSILTKPKKKRFLFAPSRDDVERMDGRAIQRSIRDRLLIRLPAYLGLREAEIVGSDKDKVKDESQRVPGLYYEDIDFARKLLLIRGKGWASGRVPPKEQPADSTTLQVLKEYAETSKLTSGKLIQLTTRQVRNIVKEVAIEVQVPHATFMSPHRLRAFFISEVAYEYDILKARDLARHSDVRTTQRYVFLSDKRKKKLQDDYEKLFDDREQGKIPR